MAVKGGCPQAKTNHRTDEGSAPVGKKTIKNRPGGAVNTNSAGGLVRGRLRKRKKSYANGAVLRLIVLKFPPQVQ